MASEACFLLTGAAGFSLLAAESVSGCLFSAADSIDVELESEDDEEESDRAGDMSLDVPALSLSLWRWR